MDAFEREKRARNLSEGFKETKGLKDGHCNRRACQAPLAEESRILGHRFSMIDHETFTNARLYYCARCSNQFTLADFQNRAEKRITVVTIPETELINLETYPRYRPRCHAGFK